MHYGWFKIGQAEVWIEPEYQLENGTEHFKVQCDIKTVSWFKIFSKLRIHMESLVQRDNLQPYKSFRNLSDGKKIDIRHDRFTYEDSVKIDAYIEDIDTRRHHAFAIGDAPVRDVMSTYLFLRSRDESVLSKEVTVRTFFTNDLYEFKMRPGKMVTHMYKTYEVGAREYELIFPEGDYFEKGKKGRVIISDDASRVPLKLELDMSVGSFSFELQDFKSGN